jgi:glycosyltransferase involved in cell wall biosynthesis
MFDQVTPLILTYDEAPNIGRTLEQLRWARDIVVVDSFSQDETVEIASTFPQVRVFRRAFDGHALQWSFGLNETGISTEWILALDADFVLSPELVDEIKLLKPSAGTQGYRAGFTYCINGRQLRSGLLRPQTVLYRRSLARYMHDGHTQRVMVAGEVKTLRARILHDDRKPLSRWLESQQQYMKLEARKILSSDPADLGRADRIRRMRVLAPLAVMFYCLFVRGGVLDGWAGFFYAFQRTFTELLLSLYLMDADLKLSGKPVSASAEKEIHTAAAVKHRL